MRYMVSVAPEHVNQDELSKWAPPGELVVPWYPGILMDAFVAVPSFRPAPYARVVEIPDFDPDALAAALAKEYPGLPRLLHEEYVVAIAMAAKRFPIGTHLQVFITPDTAKLKPIDKDEMITLWEQQPLHGRIQ